MSKPTWKVVVITLKKGGRVYAYPTEDGAVMCGMRISRDEQRRVQVQDPDGKLVCTFDARKKWPQYIEPRASGRSLQRKRVTPKKKLTRRKK